MHHCASELGWIGQANISILEQRELGVFRFCGLCWHLLVKVFEPRELRVFTSDGLWDEILPDTTSALAVGHSDDARSLLSKARGKGVERHVGSPVPEGVLTSSCCCASPGVPARSSTYARPGVAPSRARSPSASTRSPHGVDVHAGQLEKLPSGQSRHPTRTSTTSIFSTSSVPRPRLALSCSHVLA